MKKIIISSLLLIIAFFGNFISFLYPKKRPEEKLSISYLGNFQLLKPANPDYSIEQDVPEREKGEINKYNFAFLAVFSPSGSTHNYIGGIDFTMENERLIAVEIEEFKEMKPYTPDTKIISLWPINHQHFLKIVSKEQINL